MAKTIDLNAARVYDITLPEIIRRAGNDIIAYLIQDFSHTSTPTLKLSALKTVDNLRHSLEPNVYRVKN